LNLGFVAQGRRVSARFRPRPEHTGFKDTVHGGLTATVLDEAMVWACGTTAGRFAYCAELSVRFLKPVVPGSEYLAIGELVQDRKGRLFLARAELRDGQDEVYATATGKYLPLPSGAEAGALADFVSDPRPVMAATAAAARGEE
jgi:uncharacterized protein (TIGR00369 family)